MSTATNESPRPSSAKQRPFRRAVLRGLAVVLPPLLTIVILLWVGHTIHVYVLKPLELGTQWTIVCCIWDVLDEIPPEVREGIPEDEKIVKFEYRGKTYVPLEKGNCIPEYVYKPVAKKPGEKDPKTAKAIYNRYVKLTYLKWYRVIPLFLCLFILLLYLLGKFLAAGVGRLLWNSFEQQILIRLPIIRQIYSSVKQVTDFIFSEREVEYTRVVAVEYPRKGIWSLGFVTGESMVDICSAANEPVTSVLIPTSPMPATGYTITVRKSETVDLNITVDQAFQFIVSCGVVVPMQQQHGEAAAEMAAAITNRSGSSVGGSSEHGAAGDGLPGSESGRSR